MNTEKFTQKSIEAIREAQEGRAWNEWTEGTYLQPDDINGYGYLEAIKKIFIDQKGE